MKRVSWILVLAVLAPHVSAAQRVSRGAIPADVASAIAAIHNAPETQRITGVVSIARDSTVPGSLAIRGGALTLGGRIGGSLVAINSDVTFLEGASVAGQVYVVGGTITGRASAAIGGDLIAYGETLRYRISEGGEELTIEAPDGARQMRTAGSAGDFWNQGQSGTSTRFDVFSVRGGSAYNRVEGYPILIGPRLRMQRDWGSFVMYARGIVRTAEPMSWDRGTLGHDAGAEVRWRRGAGVGIGMTAFDRIDPVESWQLSDQEVALASAVLHRDYRDYYSRHGGQAYVRGYLHDNAWLRVGYGRERWDSRGARNPWSLFRDGARWRDNPAVDEGRANLLTAALTFDTRNLSYAPGTGWYVQGTVEHASFEGDRPGDPESLGLWIADRREYTRGFLDVRRYNRLAPGVQVNVRAVVGGWMSGDALPLQRRLSVGGPGTLPGFDFRTNSTGQEDRLQCSDGLVPARNVPVQCDRIALFQIEYRGSLSWHSNDTDDGHWIPRQVRSPSWLVFADAGRGWRAHGDVGAGYVPESFPSLSTFKTDVGIGLAWESVSVSVAKSLSDRREPANVVLRLTRQF